MNRAFISIALLAVLVAGGLVVMRSEMRTVVDEFRDVARQMKEALRPMNQPLETTWTSKAANEGPLHHRVVTTPLDGEEPDATAARHKTRVDALKALYPPI